MKHKSKPDSFGKCVACDTKTADKVPRGMKINEHYKEIKFKLSNHSIMRIAFCNNCIDKVTKKDFKWLMQNIILGWELSLNKLKKTKEQKMKYRDAFYNLRIVDFYNGKI